ncbi:MAG TPA: BTAD domain-containing putative transcriptional regulator [Kangiella sp.]|uniref:AfsR/SARP family transcriptional regulator n=1 Tax=Kangiella sp. TaxID=1920245 RepID=UPI002F93572C
MNNSGISLTLMGNLAIRYNGVRQQFRLTGSTKNLFMLLACHCNHTFRKEYLYDNIWPDSPGQQARSALNTALWRIKKYLNSFEGIGIVTYDDLVSLSIASDVYLDVRALENAVNELQNFKANSFLLDAKHRERLTDIVANCYGLFLEGSDEPWVHSARELYTSYYIQALTYCMRDAVASGLYESALQHGRRLLELDPFRETAQREIMWVYVMNGQRAQAIKQYLDLKGMLQKELDIEPMPETVELYQCIVSDKKPNYFLNSTSKNFDDQDLKKYNLDQIRQQIFHHLVTDLSL